MTFLVHKDSGDLSFQSNCEVLDEGYLDVIFLVCPPCMWWMDRGERITIDSFE